MVGDQLRSDNVLCHLLCQPLLYFPLGDPWYNIMGSCENYESRCLETKALTSMRASLLLCALTTSLGLL